MHDRFGTLFVNYTIKGNSTDKCTIRFSQLNNCHKNMDHFAIIQRLMLPLFLSTVGDLQFSKRIRSLAEKSLATFSEMITSIKSHFL